MPKFIHRYLNFEKLVPIIILSLHKAWEVNIYTCELSACYGYEGISIKFCIRGSVVNSSSLIVIMWLLAEYKPYLYMRLKSNMILLRKTDSREESCISDSANYGIQLLVETFPT
jgi:hypothetical protein